MEINEPQSSVHKTASAGSRSAYNFEEERSEREEAEEEEEEEEEEEGGIQVA